MMTLLPMAASAIFGIAVMPLALWVHATPAEFCGPQVIHQRPTSRLGGAIVFAAYACAVLVLLAVEHSPLRGGVALLLSALPVVGVGLIEDITRRVPPWLRLAAGIVSAALATMLSGAILPRLDTPGLDTLMLFLPFAAICTWIMVAGLCSAINIIDGSHGLAGGTALLMFLGLAVIAGLVDDRFVFAGALAMTGALSGFLVWNYPRGYVFLGDSGAYFIGFMYAELSILLIMHNPGVSAWAPLALAAYPVTETLYSIYRRRGIAHTASMQPDLLHLHSLVYRRLLATRWPAFGPVAQSKANARVAPRMWAHGTVCAAMAVLLHRDTLALVLFVAGYAVSYTAAYRSNLRRQSDTVAPAGAAD